MVSPSPIRPGFDACERFPDGALVAGLSATAATATVAFAVDELGNVGPAHTIPLARRPASCRYGSTSFRRAARSLAIWTEPRSFGLTTMQRYKRRSHFHLPVTQRFVLMDEPCPTSCPAPFRVRSSRFRAVVDGDCIVGDAEWGLDGSLRWFGSKVSGLDTSTELIVVPPERLALGQPPAVAGRRAAAELLDQPIRPRTEWRPRAPHPQATARATWCWCRGSSVSTALKRRS